MFNYDGIYLGKKAEELGFVRDTFEKVTRLADVLEYLNTNPLLKDSLALKGGTAINLTIFNLPRLSVDIDLDYLITNSREEMLENRNIINSTIDRFMVSQGYQMNPRTKNPHSLDSWIYDYTGVSGNKDNIKIEINYSLRSHIFEPEERPIITEHFSTMYKVKSLTSLEIFGSKINALLSRAAARDLYDARNMIYYGLFDETEEDLLRKCVVFYSAISSKEINKNFDVRAIDSISQRKIKTDLYPVIKNKEKFDLEVTKNIVKDYITGLMKITSHEKEFLNKFENGEYIPELLFEDKEIINRIKNHPMALWKIR
ncbi:nucleotidyl transferase AbiEii/AbiGii toxin family protein [Tissierella pigra]|uniref:Nucleotidyl transferase AbiEii/AbiGii toxin family protein n=1 Tax=Tissierella pigra TaxID=2607614 RepID=A0A6N7XK62_9FIRM|nr:nucleotidyl transferase AbiEii/AbiGii toxin family protein [Tissierella pigra]MBU5424888.1 nucleotidyl transferase AbiEii/AbiGii toxin family protein [Tissierella pigra]MSU01172.1 nucleotidyl transferase AbiEii/AbiGii toxin family protein [Tissierella pigra]